MLEESLGLIQQREEFLFRVKFVGMHATPAAAQFHGMFQMQHLVINDVLDCVAGNSRLIEDAAHDDGIVGGIVVAEAVAGVIAAPCHSRSGEQPVEESLI